eukprot:TRINITY_DN59785_c0_g1_i1.p1 TRINITY_DN59785_c0_g1~~TRINITY_DN59785_c0_g1_i1.p1  ORF type:complete len:1070 (+),score=160.33 TRINITY_DN59785_c0_g1_i1:343-3210(+)
MQRQEESWRRTQLAQEMEAENEKLAHQQLKIKSQKRYAAAIRIQRMFRGYLARAQVTNRRRRLAEMEQQFRSATAIKKVARIWLKKTAEARALLRHLGSNPSAKVGRVYDAVCCLQRFWRSCHAILDLNRRMAAVRRGWTDKLVKERRRFACNAIQRVFRGYQGRKKARTLKRLRDSRAAVLIQRGWKRKRQAFRIFRKRKELHAAQNQAAALIQACWRGYQTRLWFAMNRLQQRIDRLRNKDNRAATRIQAQWRGSRCRIAYKQRLGKQAEEEKARWQAVDAARKHEQWQEQQRLLAIEQKREDDEATARRARFHEFEEYREYDRQLFLEAVSKEGEARRAKAVHKPTTEFFRLAHGEKQVIQEVLGGDQPTPYHDPAAQAAAAEAHREAQQARLAKEEKMKQLLKEELNRTGPIEPTPAERRTAMLDQYAKTHQDALDTAEAVRKHSEKVMELRDEQTRQATEHEHLHMREWLNAHCREPDLVAEQALEAALINPRSSIAESADIRKKSMTFLDDSERPAATEPLSTTSSPASAATRSTVEPTSVTLPTKMTTGEVDMGEVIVDQVQQKMRLDKLKKFEESTGEASGQPTSIAAQLLLDDINESQPPEQPSTNTAPAEGDNVAEQKTEETSGEPVTPPSDHEPTGYQKRLAGLSEKIQSEASKYIVPATAEREEYTPQPEPQQQEQEEQPATPEKKKEEEEGQQQAETGNETCTEGEQSPTAATGYDTEATDSYIVSPKTELLLQDLSQTVGQVAPQTAPQEVPPMFQQTAPVPTNQPIIPMSTSRTAEEVEELKRNFQPDVLPDTEPTKAQRRREALAQRIASSSMAPTGARTVSPRRSQDVTNMKSEYDGGVQQQLASNEEAPMMGNSASSVKVDSLDGSGSQPDTRYQGVVDDFQQSVTTRTAEEESSIKIQCSFRSYTAKKAAKRLEREREHHRQSLRMEQEAEAHELD